MKKLLAVILAVALMVSLVACSKGGWEATLEEYEEFVDEYVAAMKAGDDLTELDEKGEEWDAKLSETLETLEGEDKEKFESEAARITMKVLGGLGDMDLGEDTDTDTDADVDLGLDELEDSLNELEDSLDDFDF